MKIERAQQYLIFIGANVRRLRSKGGFTQEQLAEMAELEPSFIQKVERGVSNVSVESLVRLAEALGVEPGRLFRASKVPDRKVGRPKQSRDADQR